MEFMGYISREKDKLNRLLRQYEEKKRNFEQYRLYEKTTEGKKRYYYSLKGDSRQHYIGWRKHPDLLRNLLEADHAKKKIPLIEENLKMLEKLETRYHTSEEILRGGVPGMTTDRKTEETTIPASKNPKRREELQHDTGLGFFTRSKSEAIIALRLHAWGIRFGYEEPLRIKGADGRWKTIYPDFTIYLADGRVVYLEHLGMFSKSSYREGAVERLGDYHAAGILAGRDLFLTMDGPDGELDTAAIDRLIEDNFI
ncbi:MAG: hypothetical protein ACI4LJ_02215 [Anaerovoracaceae bacterium]